MMQKKNKNYWTGMKLILFIPALILLLQAFAQPEKLVEKASEFVPSIIQKDSSDVWLERWTVENIKHGVYQPNGIKSDEYPLGKQNTLRIMLNRNNDYLVGNEIVAKGDMKNSLTDFIDGNHSNGELVRDFIEKDLPLIGKVKVPKSIVFFNYDKASSIEARNNSLRILGGTYLKARQEKANDLFNQNYFDLNKEKRDVVDQVVPILFGYSSIAISEPRALKIFLAKSGKVQIENKEFSIDEFENHLIMANKSVKESYKKWGYETSLITSVKVEVGVSALQILQLKEALRKAKILNVNYSTENKESEWKANN